MRIFMRTPNAYKLSPTNAILTPVRDDPVTRDSDELFKEFTEQVGAAFKDLRFHWDQSTVKPIFLGFVDNIKI